MLIFNDFSRDRLRKIMRHINAQGPEIATSLRRSLRICFLGLRSQAVGKRCELYQDVRGLDLFFKMTKSPYDYWQENKFGRISFQGERFQLEILQPVTCN